MLTAVSSAFIGIWVAVLDNQNRYILPLLVSGILILAVSSAIAQEHLHPPQDQTIHEQFYSTWMMPDNRNLSCCRNVDCSPVAQSRHPPRYRNAMTNPAS